MKKNLNDLTVDMARNYAEEYVGTIEGYEAYAEFEDIVKAYINGAKETRIVFVSEIVAWIRQNCKDIEFSNKLCNHLHEYTKCPK